MLRIVAQVIVSLATAAVLCGQVAPAPALTPPAVSGDVTAGDIVAPDWIHTATLRTGLGWRDNLLLSSFAPLSREFAQAEIEALSLWSHEDWQFISLINGDVVRFFSPPVETAGEHLWYGHGELRWRHWPSWQVTMKADGFLQNTVVDLSETDAVRTVLPARVRGGFTTFATRVTLPGRFAFEPFVQARRTDYRNFSGDYDEHRVGGRLEWSGSERLKLSAAWFEHRRAYRERPEYSAGGRPRAGTRLHFWQRTFEAKAETSWTRGGDWTLEVSGGRLENRDHSSGFFDYDQERVGLQIDWERDRWKVNFNGDGRQMTYLVQTVGVGITPPPRKADTADVELRVEYQFHPAWSVFTRYQRERTRSNEVGFSYLANIASAGVQCEF